MVRLPFTQIADSMLPPRISILGYVKVGGLQDKIIFTRKGKPWLPPTRYTNPARFEITTREKRIEEVKGQKDVAGQTFSLHRGYVRDQRIHERLGAKPDEIDVRFMFPTWQENFVFHLGAHNGSRWICQGNGVVAKDLVRGDVGCPCARLKQWEGAFKADQYPELEGRNADYRKREHLVPCKPRGVLSMILPDAETFGGFHVYKTTSWESIANIATQLQLFEKQFGRLDGLPFKLKVYPATKSYGDGEGSTTQPIVTLVIAASFDTARQIAAAAAEESRRYLLLAGGSPDPSILRRELELEMEEEVTAEGAEFHSEAAAQDEGPTMEERLRKRAELPIVQGRAAPTAPQAERPASSSPGPTPPAAPEPDFEVVDPDEPEDPEGQPHVEQVAAPAWTPPEAAAHCRSGLELNHRAYLDALRDVVPHWGNAEVVAWQTAKVKKGSTRTWEALDFDLAAVFLRRGETSIAPQAPAGAGTQGGLGF